MRTPNKEDRKNALAVLKAAYPNAKLGKQTNDNLLWLMEIVALWPKTGKRSMSDTLRKYREGYEQTTSYSGRKSLNNGDAVAHFLDGMTPMEVLHAAERILGFEDGELINRYAHLNIGAQRMNGGNLLRGAIKRQDIKEADLH